MSTIVKAKFKRDIKYNDNISGHRKSPIHKKQHGRARSRGRFSNYKAQLVECQKVKSYYYMSEKSLRRAYIKSKGEFDTLLGLCERRLGSIIYRIGFASSIFEAAQRVSHKHFSVSGKSVNKRSHTLDVGEEVTLSPTGMKFIKRLPINIPSYIEHDEKNNSFKFIRLPLAEEIPLTFIVNGHNIIERYRKLV